MLSARIEFPSTLSQRLWSWIWIWQTKTFPPLSTSGRIWSQYLYRELSRRDNWICTCHVSCTCPGLLHTRVSPGHISVKKWQEWHEFSIFIEIVLLYLISRECQIAFSKVSYFNIQYCYSEDVKLVLVWCDLWSSEGRNIYWPSLNTEQTVQTPDSPITWSVWPVSLSVSAICVPC